MSVDFDTRLIVAKQRLVYAKLTHRGGMVRHERRTG